MIQIFGTKKCRDTQKAIRFFADRRVETQFRDMTVKPPSPGELDDMAAALGGYDTLLDPDCPAAQERGLAYMDYDSREELLRDPRLYKTPLVRQTPLIRAGKGRAVVGFDEGAIKKLVG
jgi:arsenate reductase-like glutaredoxin family protein